MDRIDLTILAVFVAVAEERSFTKAGKRLGVSPSAMSHAVRGLEEDIGVRLLSRTTRSVAPTEAGEQLLARLRPAITDIQDALDQLAGLRDKPAGRVRLTVPRPAGTTVMAANLAKFTRDYPDVLLELTADDSRVEQQLANGELIRVLEDWCQPLPGFFLYYPSRRQQPAALSALINTLRL